MKWLRITVKKSWRWLWNRNCLIDFIEICYWKFAAGAVVNFVLVSMIHCDPRFTWTLLPKPFTRLEMCISSISISYFTIQEVSISSSIKIVSGKNHVFWDVLLCSLLEIYWCFISIDCCQIPTKIYGVTFQKTVFFIVTAMESLDLTWSQWVSQQGVHH